MAELGWEWIDVAGGGFLGTVLLLALVEWLRTTFATRHDVATLRARCDAVAGSCEQLRAALEDTRLAVRALESEDRHQWERVNGLVLDPLERITRRLEEVGTAQAVQAAALQQIQRSLNY